MLGTNNTLSNLRGFGFSKAFKLRGRLQSGVLMCQRMTRSVYPPVSPPDLESLMITHLYILDFAGLLYVQTRNQVRIIRLHSHVQLHELYT